MSDVVPGQHRDEGRGCSIETVEDLGDGLELSLLGPSGQLIARIIPQSIVRVLVVLAGAALTVAMALKYWF